MKRKYVIPSLREIQIETYMGLAVSDSTYSGGGASTISDDPQELHVYTINKVNNAGSAW